MKNAYEVLKQKEVELDRVRREIESLRIVASLLLDGSDAQRSDDAVPTAQEKTDDAEASLEPTGSDGLFSSVTNPNSGIWKVLRRNKSHEADTN